MQDIISCEYNWTWNFQRYIFTQAGSSATISRWNWKLNEILIPLACHTYSKDADSTAQVVEMTPKVL